ADYVANGVGGTSLGGTCELVPHVISAAGEQLGQYWVRVWEVDPSDYLYQIESWGWSPDTTSRQVANQKVSIQVRLVPDADGFTNALFAEANLSGLNRKEIYGDVYTGQTATVSNFTRIFPNDAGYIGTGRLRVRGDLMLGNGSNSEFWGTVQVQGVIRDDNPGTYFADMDVHNDESVEPLTTFGGESFFQNADVAGEARFKNNPGFSGSLSGTVVPGVTGLDEVPIIPLPTFTWNAGDYPTTPTVHASSAAFQTWFTTNKGSLSGVHFVPEATELDFTSGATLSDDFMVVVDGSVEVRSSPATAPSPDPIDLIVVQLDPNGRLTTSNKVVGSDGVLHHLLFTNGEFDAANQTTIYGAVYGKEDVSSNRLEVHFRPPEDSLVKGFDFMVPDPDSFVPQPLVWRSVPVSQPTPITDYCGVPGGATASVPAPSPTSSTTTTAPTTTTTTTGSTGPTTTVAPSTTTTTVFTCVTLPNGKCKNKP
ncbi:MAG: hypothetical protein AB1Z57_05210, partial [Acidimicrobiia bacterium]